MPRKILRIESSIFNQNGTSSQLSRELTEQIRDEDSQIKVRDLAQNPLPHFDTSVIEAIGKGEAKLADTLIEEVQAADVIVIGAPMYNFSIPTQLKSWFDYIARAKVTFQYTANGPEGLLKNKKVYVVTTRGGIHKDTPNDHITPYLNTMLNFVGLDDVEYIFVEGLGMSEVKEKSITEAKALIQQLSQIEEEA